MIDIIIEREFRKRAISERNNGDIKRNHSEYNVFDMCMYYVLFDMCMYYVLFDMCMYYVLFDMCMYYVLFDMCMYYVLFMVLVYMLSICIGWRQIL